MNLLPAYLLLVIIITVYGYFDLKKKPPKPATKFRWTIDMKNAKVTLTWKKSVSVDAVDQHVVVQANGVDVVDVHLPTDVESLEVGVFAENTVLTATHVTVDGNGKTGEAVVPSFTVPDLENPQPATDFGWTMEVVDVE